MGVLVRSARRSQWFTRLCAAAVIAQTLIDIDPHYPAPDPAARQELERARRELEAEAAGPGKPGKRR